MGREAAPYDDGEIYDLLFRDFAYDYDSICSWELAGAGQVKAAHRSTTKMRSTFKPEMELLLRNAAYVRWQLCSGFEGQPLTR
jgi:hypothetical protein